MPIADKPYVLLFSTLSSGLAELNGWFSDPQYHLSAADSDEQAAQHLGKQTFDLIIIDGRRTGINVLPLVERFKQLSGWDIPSLIVAARLSAGQLAEIYRVGIADCLIEPFDLKLARAKAAQFIAWSRASRTSAQQEQRFNEQRIEDFAEIAGCWFWETDATLRFTWMTKSVETIVNAPREWHYGKTRTDIGMPDLAPEKWQEHLALLAAHKPFQNFEYRRHSPYGVQWLRTSGVPVFDEQGDFQGYRGIGRDVSDLKHDEYSMHLIRSVVAHTHEAILIVRLESESADPEIIYANRAFMEMSGFSANEIINKTIYVLLDAKAEPAALEGIQQQFHRGQPFTREIVSRRKSGGEFLLEWYCEPVYNEAGRILHWIIHQREIKLPWLTADHIAQMVSHDILTGLPNRLSALQRLTRIVTRTEDNQPFAAVLFFNLDRFKKINDSLGHDAGDALLKAVAARLKLSVRQSDLVARIGVDEFIILLENVRSRAALQEIIQKLLKALSPPYPIDNQEISVTASLGISCYPSDSRDAETLIRNADIAMHYAKTAGGNGFKFFTREMGSILTKRLGLERSLANAIERDEFILHYQPQVAIHNGRIIGAEALLRWQHSEHGFIMPGVFISMLEDMNLITSVGEWVLQTAIAQNRAWQQKGLPPIRVSVNLSAHQINAAELIPGIQRILSDIDLESRYLALEITESGLIENFEQTILKLHQLNALGVRVELDDFGTGYSSLSYLKHFKIDGLKIDRSFIRDLPEDSYNVAIVKTIIGLARSLQLSVTAEGVETSAQLDFLRSQNCQVAQGYLYSRPLAVDEFEKLLETQPWL